uniref:Uncharacterized protein n=1 Tax=Arundo donax TaxID=35708 RepID=A0A0A9H418_ARUDO
MATALPQPRTSSSTLATAPTHEWTWRHAAGSWLLPSLGSHGRRTEETKARPLRLHRARIQQGGARIWSPRTACR